MCGIMGYLGENPAAGILLEGLKRLEYRGYDSAGIAVYQDEKIQLERAKGKLTVLEKKVEGKTLFGKVGIGHTRWATHGPPSDENAHPHRSDHIVVVHNGIIENHMELRARLKEKGFQFRSETDTEIVPFLVESYVNQDFSLEDATRKAISDLEGAFALAIFCAKEPDRIVVAKNASPLIIGVAENEMLVASDIPALLPHTRNVVVLEDGDMAIVTRDSWKVTDFEGKPVERKMREITWSRVMAEKEGYKHFMLKEIFEQPRAITDTCRARVMEATEEIVLDEIKFSTEALEKLSRITILACGTSYHAALVGKFWFEQMAKIPTEVDLASEFRYRNPILDKDALIIPISQSGETADTLAALDEGKRLGARVLSICNVIDSSIARRSDDVLYTHAGPEIGVASTKAFTTQLAALAMLAVYFGNKKGSFDQETLRSYLHDLISLPRLLEEVLRNDQQYKDLANKYFEAQDFLFLGRGSSYPIALEGALKLKEISYIHAEGYPGGEIKHGPIALIDEKMPIVALATGGKTNDKMISNIQEVCARGGQVIALVEKGDERLKDLVADLIEIPAVGELNRPIVETIPLQLLSYYIADRRGTDVDQPRNLAKSVTVE